MTRVKRVAVPSSPTFEDRRDPAMRAAMMASQALRRTMGGSAFASVVMRTGELVEGIVTRLEIDRAYKDEVSNLVATVDGHDLPVCQMHDVQTGGRRG